MSDGDVWILLRGTGCSVTHSWPSFLQTTKNRSCLCPSIHQYELMILQKANSQHIFRLLWCSGRSPDEHLDGSTSQFSSDSYRALMNSPAENKQRNLWDMKRTFVDHFSPPKKRTVQVLCLFVIWNECKVLSWARTDEEYDAKAAGDRFWCCPSSLFSLTCDNKHKH